MPYYLVPFVRPDGRSRGRRPRGYDHASHNFITLGKGEGARALIWFDDPFDDPEADKIADGTDEALALATRSTLSALVTDREYRDSTQRFELAIADLLRRPPAHWGVAALCPSFARARYEVWLGPGGRGKNLFHVEPARRAKHSKAWSDDFAGDGNLDGRALTGSAGNWDEPNGTLWVTLSGRARAATFTDDQADDALIDSDGDTDDLYAQADVVTFTRPVDTALRVFLYAGANATLTSGYWFRVRIDEANQPGRLLLAISADIDLAADNVNSTTGILRLERDGSSVEAFVNGVSVLGPVTDTSEPNGVGNRRVGFGARWTIEMGSAGTRVVELENFSGGDLVQASLIPVKVHHLRQQGIA